LSLGISELRIPLAFLPEGTEAVVIEIVGGRCFVRRLYELGFTPGVKVKVVSSGFRGPVLVEVRGARIALGRGAAMKVIVERKL